jgi:hypothetical protein
MSLLLGCRCTSEYATSLDTTNLIDALVPCSLNEILQLQNAWCSSGKFFEALSFGTLDIREEHLDVSVAAEATFLGSLADVKSRWVTVVRLLDGSIERRELGENRYDTWCLVLDRFLLDEAAIAANAVDDGNLWAGVKLIVQPTGHAVLPCIGAELGFLEIISVCTHKK